MSRRLLAGLLVADVVLLGGAVAASVRPFVRPDRDRLTPADAIVVPSGDHRERLALALRLLRERRAPTLVLDGQPDFEEAERLCAADVAFEVVCLRPEPDSTRDEARAAGRLAASRGWDRVIVATSTAHVTRARLLFGRCVDGRVAVAGADPPYGGRTLVRAISHEWLGTFYAVVASRRC